MKRPLITIFALTALGFGLAQNATVDMSDRSIAEILDEAEQVSILNVMVDAAGLDETLRTGGPFTVFAPVDRAWTGVDTGTIQALLRNPEALEAVLLYHVISGGVDSSQLFELLLADAGLRIGDENTPGMEIADPVEALEHTEGEDEEAALGPGQIGDEETVNPTIEDPVDALLATGVTSAVTFETVQGARVEIVAGRTSDTTLDGGLQIGEGEQLLGIAEPVAALRVEGVDLMVDDASFVSLDIVASNGVIHLIDRVLVPEGLELPN